MDPNPNFSPGDWKRWREVYRLDASRLAQGARAWCTSSHWQQHTPALEDWKTVVEGLGQQRLSEAAVTEMSSVDGGGLPFPTIPLFEDEQIEDFCRVLEEPEAAAALADRVEASGPMLTVDPAKVAEKCFLSLPAPARSGLTIVAWKWMLQGAGARQLPLPKPDQITALLNRKSTRREAAVRALEEVLPERFDSAELPAAMAAADVLSLWRTPSFFEWALGLYERSGKPGPLGARLKAALEAVGPALSTDSLKSRLREDGFAIPEEPVQDRGVEPMADALLHGIAEPGQWAVVEDEIRKRKPGFAASHPLRRMAHHLIDAEFVEVSEEAAWQQLVAVLTRYPVLLEVDTANPAGILPALDLAAVIRSASTIGQVALDLVTIAGACRMQPAWWKAVRVGLRPGARRGGFGNPGDRSVTAMRVLQLFAPRLSAAEAGAMQAAFAGEGVNGGK